jgi:hypothetical protein
MPGLEWACLDVLIHKILVCNNIPCIMRLLHKLLPMPDTCNKNNQCQMLRECVRKRRLCPNVSCCERAYSNAAEEEIASRSEAISDGAERVLKFSILYTQPHTHTTTHPHNHTPTHTPLHKTLLSTYMRRS